MSTQFYHEAMRWFSTTWRDLVMRQVAWRRGNNSWNVRAVVVDDRYRTSLPAGTGDLFVESVNRRWIIWRDDLPVTPHRGDLIVETIQGRDFIHEVLPGDGEPDWSYADYEHRFITVRTRVIGSAS